MRKRAIVQLVVVVFGLSLIPLINGCSEESTTSPGIPSVQDTSPPAPPTGLSFEGRESGLILRWSPNVEPDLVGYNVYLYQPSPNRLESYVKLNKQLLSGTEFRRGRMQSETEMVLRLTAVDQVGNESAFSTLIVASNTTVQIRE